MLTVVERRGAVSTERGRERWPETTLVEITRSRALTMKLLKQPAKHEEGTDPIEQLCGEDLGAGE